MSRPLYQMPWEAKNAAYHRSVSSRSRAESLDLITTAVFIRPGCLDLPVKVWTSSPVGLCGFQRCSAGPQCSHRKDLQYVSSEKKQGVFHHFCGKKSETLKKNLGRHLLITHKLSVAYGLSICKMRVLGLHEILQILEQCLAHWSTI